VGKSRVAVANTLRLLNLPEKLRDAVSDGSISAGHARNLVSIGDARIQDEIAGKILSDDLSVREVEKMVSDWKKIPITHGTFLIGALAIAGVPPLAGFFSKDEILIHAWQRSPLLYAIGALTAFLTAFYVFRAVALAFWGESRVDAETHVHEPPPIMTLPLALLAALSVAGGWIGSALGAWLSPVFAGAAREVRIAHGLESALMAGSVVAGLGGIGLAVWLYWARPQLAPRLASAAGALYRLVENKYYVDEIYGAVIVRPMVAVSRKFLWRVMDAGVIDGAVNLVGLQAAVTGEVLRRIQSGNIRSYAGWVVLGAVAVVVAMGMLVVGEA
jgi:NADH-quinone oxidoreductase subunit L